MTAQAVVVVATDAFNEGFEDARTLNGDAFQKALEAAFAMGEAKVRQVTNEFALQSYVWKYDLSIPNYVNIKDQVNKNLGSEQANILYANLWDCLGNAKNKAGKDSCLSDALKELRDLSKGSSLDKDRAFMTHCYKDTQFTCVKSGDFYNQFNQNLDNRVKGWAASGFDKSKAWNFQDFWASICSNVDVCQGILRAAYGTLAFEAILILGYILGKMGATGGVASYVIQQVLLFFNAAKWSPYVIGAFLGMTATILTNVSNGKPWSNHLITGGLLGGLTGALGPGTSGNMNYFMQRALAAFGGAATQMTPVPPATLKAWYGVVLQAGLNVGLPQFVQGMCDAIQAQFKSELC